jgi:hypothetical protein
MQEYEELGHINQLNEDASSVEERYYLPHHAVFKSSSSTTRIRVVFDVSCRSSNGLSLNDPGWGGKLQLCNNPGSLMLLSTGTVVKLRDRNEGNVAATTYLSTKELGNARGSLVHGMSDCVYC